ncbi:hypothetical protein NBEOAGPD_3296 [Methylobacterium gregans]|uniref:Uncharacterized protein n=1 Tax=Methylobacterium gregans TaxID=374424 RepID=A0AA37HR51_9HYPH|nr:hypothetical protein NBEOAGPD_3296 [Methylobacterium gregans]
MPVVWGFGSPGTLALVVMPAMNSPSCQRGMPIEANSFVVSVPVGSMFCACWKLRAAAAVCGFQRPSTLPVL